MIQSCVKALGRSVRAFALAAVALGVGAGALTAQSTGKLEGTVSDPTGIPIAGARVQIVGTAFTATTNAQGYYFIVNIPASSVDVRASQIGYTPKELTAVKILTGQTITQNFQLGQNAQQVQTIEVVAATNALVPRDQVTTRQAVDGSFTDKLPVDRISNVLALQPGVSSNSNGGSISVRGSRTDENLTIIDGVPVTPGNRGTGSATRGVSTAGVATNAFEDASITTGATSAEFGNAQGGVIQIATRTGGSRYAGSLAYETDEFSGLNYSTGFNRIQASIGGPLIKDLTFFVGGALEGSRYGIGGYNAQNIPSFVNAGIDTVYRVPTGTSANADSIDVPVYNRAVVRGQCDADYVAGASTEDIRNNFGLPCQGNRGSYSPTGTYQLTGRLAYSFGQGSRLSASYIGTQTESRGLRGTDFTNASRDRTGVAILNWTQTLFKSASRQVALDAFASYQFNSSISAPLTSEGEAATRNPFGGFLIGKLDYLYDPTLFKVTDDLVRRFRIASPTGALSIYDRINTSQYNSGQSSYSGAIAIGGGAGGGGGSAGTISSATEGRYIGRATIDAQLDRYNRLRIGGEATKWNNLDSYSVGASSASGFPDLWLAKPLRYDVFVEDRLDLGDVVLTGGLRYDYFKINAEKWKDFPRISSLPGFSADSLDNFLTEYQGHNYLSPHIQVAFPVTEKTNFRLSYAQQVQNPDFSVALQGSNTDLSVTNTNNNYGSDLDFAKTILFEFGVRHAFNEDMVLDVAVYNKDNLSNSAGRLVPFLDPLKNIRSDVRLTVNQDFGNTRGVDVRLDRRFGNLFNGALSYSFQEAKNTGSDPYTYINFGSRIVSGLGGSNAPPPQLAQTINSSRPHILAAQFALNFPADYKQGSFLGAVLGRVGLSGVGRLQSGTPYTRCPSTPGTPGYDASDIGRRSGGVCAKGLEGDYNAARLPAFKQFDARLTKGFALGRLDITAYADARNLFNFKNITSVYAQTGTTFDQAYVNQVYSADSSSLAALFGASSNNLYNKTNGDITLPTTRAGCATFKTTSGSANAPQCEYYRQAEQRFGNGDGVFTLAEQRKAIELNNRGTFHISNFVGSQRALRFGAEVTF